VGREVLLGAPFGDALEDGGPGVGGAASETVLGVGVEDDVGDRHVEVGFGEWNGGHGVGSVCEVASVGVS